MTIVLFFGFFSLYSGNHWSIREVLKVTKSKRHVFTPHKAQVHSRFWKMSRRKIKKKITFKFDSESKRNQLPLSDQRWIFVEISHTTKKISIPFRGIPGIFRKSREYPEKINRNHRDFRIFGILHWRFFRDFRDF